MPEIAQKKSIKIVPPGKRKCVWMEAGVVSYKLCDNNYDCSTCSYDQAMQIKVARKKETAEATAYFESIPDKFTETWVDKMMHLPASQRKCRYMITGEISRKICPNSYDCGNCSFDQMMQERLQAEALPVHSRKQVAGFELVEDIYYHEGHTWARPEYGGRVRVGIDDFAERLLRKLSRVQLPDVGHEVKQGGTGFRVIKDNQNLQVLSPVSGVVTHVNHKLMDHPELISESPYEEGWLFIVEPTRLRKNLKGLYYGEEAEKYMKEERERLFSMAHDDLKIAADGGVSEEDVFEELQEKNWEKVVKAFLKA